MCRNLDRQQWSGIPVSGSDRAQYPLLHLVAGTRMVSCMHLMMRRDTAAAVRCKSRSGRFAVVVSQHAAKPLAARYLTGSGAHFLARLNQSVIEPLVIALCVIMGHETNHGGF
jgi:hypothetical protein